MKHLLRHRDSDALLDGDPVDESAGLDEVAAFLSDMRVEFGAMPAPAPRPTLAATLDGRRELRPASSGPVPKPTIPEPGPKVHYRFKSIAAMVASGVVLFGGLATAGALPGPAQRAVADVTSHLGIHLPGRTVSQPASNGIGTTSSHAGTTVTTPGSGHSTVPTTPNAGTQPTSGSTTATTVPAGGATVPSAPVVSPTTPSTVTVPSLPTTPTLPNPIPPIVGALPPLGALPAIPGVTEPLHDGGLLHEHRIP
jgi:hypothetical protein